jgi:hypothetical protein
MPSLTFSIQYQKNTGLVLSATELEELYFFGIPIVDQFGNKISPETITFYIEAAQKEIENYLSIKIIRQCVMESRDYYYDDWVQWGYIPSTYPVVKPLSLKGYANSSLQLEYPQQWLSSKRQTPDEDLYYRTISLVPVSGSGATIVTGVIGLAPYVGFWGNKIVPNYWELTYITGFNKVPKDIIDAMGKLAAMNLFIILGEIVLGPGIASKSIGIDGLSQSVSSTASAMYSAFSARIEQYTKDLERMKPAMKSRYLGIVFGVM